MTSRNFDATFLLEESVTHKCLRNAALDQQLRTVKHSKNETVCRCGWPRLPSGGSIVQVLSHKQAALRKHLKSCLTCPCRPLLMHAGRFCGTAFWRGALAGWDSTQWLFRRNALETAQNYTCTLREEAGHGSHKHRTLRIIIVRTNV